MMSSLASVGHESFPHFPFRCVNFQNKDSTIVPSQVKLPNVVASSETTPQRIG